MTVIVVSIVLFFVLLRLYSAENGRQNPNSRCTTAVFFVLAVGLRIAAALVYKGCDTDMTCFSAWADAVYKNGTHSFYTSGAFADYPPGYIYILYVLGFLKNVFHVGGAVETFLLKTPAMICDFLCAAVICRLSRDNFIGKFSALLFLLNPAVILNSAIWGQVDSVFTFFVLLSLYLAYKKKYYISYFVFAAAAFIKPQSLFYAPILLFAAIDEILSDAHMFRALLKHICVAAASVIFVVLLALPFNITAVISQYINTVGSYNYASVNAYNIWTALGLNWHAVTPVISVLGYLSVPLAVIISAVLYFTRRTENRIFLLSALICILIFTFSVKMHERYAYPAIALLLCSYAVSKQKKELLIFIGITAVQVINTAHVLFCYTPQTYHTSGFSAHAVWFAWLSVAVFTVGTAHIIFGKDEKNE